MAEISFITSSRGGRLLLCNGHLYANTCKDYKGKTYWACEKKGCHGRVCLKNDECAYEIGTHDHEPNIKKIERLKFMEKLKELVRQDLTTPVGKIYRDLYQSLSKELKSIMPSLKTVENILYRYRSTFKPSTRQRNTAKMRRYPNQVQTSDSSKRENNSNEIVEDMPSSDIAEQNKFLEIFSLMFLDSQAKQETQMHLEKNTQGFHADLNAILPEDEPLSDMSEMPNKVLENLSNSSALIDSCVSHETSLQLRTNSLELAVEQEVPLSSHSSLHPQNESMPVTSSDTEKCEMKLHAKQNSSEIVLQQDKSSISSFPQNNTNALTYNTVSSQNGIENSTNLHISSSMQIQQAQLSKEKLLIPNQHVLLKPNPSAPVYELPNTFNASLGMMNKVLNNLSKTKEIPAQSQGDIHKQAHLLNDANSYVQIQVVPSVSMMSQQPVILQPSYNLLNSAILPSLSNTVIAVIPDKTSNNTPNQVIETKSASVSNGNLCSLQGANVSLKRKDTSQQTLISTQNYLIRQRRKLACTPYATILLRAKQKAIGKRRCGIFQNKFIANNRESIGSAQVELATAQFELAASQRSLAKAQHKLAAAQEELAAAYHELATVQREIAAAKKNKPALSSHPETEERKITER